MKVLVASVGLPHTVTGEFVPFPSSIAETQRIADNTRKWYLENSYGKLALDFTVVPQVININNNIYVGAHAALAALGFKQSDYGIILYLSGPVGYSGGGGTAGNISWVYRTGSDYAYFASIHEIGHALGLAHCAQIRTGGRDPSGKVFTMPGLAAAQTANAWVHRQEPGGVSSMSYSAYSAHFSAAEKAQLGWITPAVYDGGDRTYQLTALPVQGGALYGIKIAASPTRTYWIEYRQKAGFDSGMPGGVFGININMIGADFSCVTPTLIDATPATDWAGDAAFLVGDTFTDGTITIDIIGPGQVRVRTGVVQPVAAAPGVVRPPAPFPQPVAYDVSEAELESLRMQLSIFRI